MNIDEIADQLLQALDSKSTIPPITSRVPGFDQTMAYAVSAEILRRRRARGERAVGRKIGFTNRTLWPRFGVGAPVWAHVFDSTVVYLPEASGTLPVGHLLQPHIEPEVVFHFSRAPEKAQNEAELLSCIDWMALGFEIVQCHFPGWKFEAPDTIAAFGLHAALAVGSRRPVADAGAVAAQLRTFTLALALDGHEQGQGSGSDVLDSPVLALAHLRQLLQDQPGFAPIQAGEIVTTGSLTMPEPIRPGQTWTAAPSGIGLSPLSLRLV
jgi:2-keto-4-pentenoate hydratase